MMDRKPFPKYRMKVVLSPRLQELFLPFLPKFGVMETFPIDHELFMNASAFMAFMHEVSKVGNATITVKQLRMEQIDLRKLPERSYVNYVGGDRENGKESSSDDH